MIFLKSQNISIDYSSFDASKSTDMIEMFNKLVEDVLRKNHNEID